MQCLSVAGLRTICREASDRLAGIGDTTSDLAIREQVSFFACPANALDEVKDVADYVARSADLHLAG